MDDRLRGRQHHALVSLGRVCFANSLRTASAFVTRSICLGRRTAVALSMLSHSRTVANDYAEYILRAPPVGPPSTGGADTRADGLEAG